MRWNVGDIVRVVDEPYDDCPASWVDSMNDTCGYEVVITSAVLRHDDRFGEWQLCTCKPTDPTLDRRAFNWNFCSNCFVQIEPDFEMAPEIDMKDLFGL